MDRSRITVGDAVVDVALEGRPTDPLVVLLHGFPQTADAWSGVGPALAAAGYRVAAPDQRGYAPATAGADAEAYALPELIGDVLELADALGAHRFDVVGHDWGGVVGWALAADHPERVRSLAAVSTPHPRAMLRALRHRDQQRRSVYVAVLRSPVAVPLLLAVRGLGLRVLLRASGLSHDRVPVYVDAMRRPGVLRAALHWYRANGGRRLRAVGTVAVPTLYVWGRHDPALGPDAARMTADHVSGPYEFVAMDAGHWLPERHAERLTRLLLDHLRGQRSG